MVVSAQIYFHFWYSPKPMLHLSTKHHNPICRSRITNITYTHLKFLHNSTFLSCSRASLPLWLSVNHWWSIVNSHWRWRLNFELQLSLCWVNREEDRHKHTVWTMWSLQSPCLLPASPFPAAPSGRSQSGGVGVGATRAIPWEATHFWTLCSKPLLTAFLPQGEN